MKFIAKKLGVSVSSVSLWTRDIALTEEQLEALRQGNHRLDGQRAGSSARGEVARDARRRAQLDGRHRARAYDPLHLCGCMLFWAEGSRRRNCVIFTNTDVAMAQTFVRFLRECYGVRDEQFCVSVNCHLNNGLTLEEIESWWLDKLALPAGCLRAAAINRVSRYSKRRRRLHPYGTIRIQVHSTFIVQSIYGAIQEYTGVEQPEWLD